MTLTAGRGVSLLTLVAQRLIKRGKRLLVCQQTHPKLIAAEVRRWQTRFERLINHPRMSRPDDPRALNIPANIARDLWAIEKQLAQSNPNISRRIV